MIQAVTLYATNQNHSKRATYSTSPVIHHGVHTTIILPCCCTWSMRANRSLSPRISACVKAQSSCRIVSYRIVSHHVIACHGQRYAEIDKLTEIRMTWHRHWSLLVCYNYVTSCDYDSGRKEGRCVEQQPTKPKLTGPVWHVWENSHATGREENRYTDTAEPPRPYNIILQKTCMTQTCPKIATALRGPIYPDLCP